MNDSTEERRPIELSAPDISAHRAGNIGIDYASTYDSGKAGPHVMVQALTHGNEICGAIALNWLHEQNIRPARGRLSLVYGNVEAYARWDPADPDRSRFVDEDFNRVWSDEALRGNRNSVELRRARYLVDLVDCVDYLLDIHSMSEPCKPIMVCGADGRGGEKGAAFSRQLRVPEYLLIDTGHPAGLRMIERRGFGVPTDSRTAVLVECGQHWERRAVDVAIDTLVRFLQHTGVVSEDWARGHLRLATEPEQKLVRVTQAVVARSPAFRFERLYRGLEIIPKAGEAIATDGEDTIRAPYDNTVLVMPSSAHLKVGNTMVRLGRFEPA